MSSALFAQLDDLQNLSWEASGEEKESWKTTDPDTSLDTFESTESDSDTRSVVSMSSNATSIQASLRKPEIDRGSSKNSPKQELRPLPGSSKALGSAFDTLGTMLDCLEASVENEILEMQQALEETVDVLRNSAAWNTRVFRKRDLFPENKVAKGEKKTGR